MELNAASAHDLFEHFAASSGLMIFALGGQAIVPGVDFDFAGAMANRSGSVSAAK